jgi:hypothetical protein
VPERSNDLIFTLTDGREVETSFLSPYTVAEQIAFEEKFRCSFMAVEQAVGEIRRAAQAAEGPDAVVDPAQAFRVHWILWFGWRRARGPGGLRAKFSEFIDSQLEDWTFVVPEKPPTGELEDGSDENMVDAKVLDAPGRTGDPLIDQMDHEAAASEDGSLDPTGVPQPA